MSASPIENENAEKVMLMKLVVSLFIKVSKPTAKPGNAEIEDKITF